MAVRVVRGVVRSAEPGSAAVTRLASTSFQQQAVTATISTQVVRSATYSDASFTTLRGSRNSVCAERIRDSKEARSVARRVGDRIRYDDPGVEAHSGLCGGCPREHFAE